MNTKLHAVTDSVGHPIQFFITAGQVSDHVGARALCGSLPAVDWLIADRVYDADWFRETLRKEGIRPCIPGRKSRDEAVRYAKRRYKRRNRIEIMFGRWRFRLTAAREDVEDHVGRVDAFAQCLSAGGLNGFQSVGQHRADTLSGFAVFDSRHGNAEVVHPGVPTNPPCCAVISALLPFSGPP